MAIRSTFIEKSVVARIAGLQGIEGNFELRKFVIDHRSVPHFESPIKRTFSNNPLGAVQRS